MTQQPAPAARPQAVLSPLTSAAVFLVLRIEPGGETQVRELLGEVADLRRAVGFRVPDTGLQVVVGVGSHAWDRLFTGPRPRDLHEFRALHGDKHHAPATEGDLLFHIRAGRPDACYEFARQVAKRLADSATVIDDVQGFQYFDRRDLLGFVDGTENPEGDAASAAVTITADEDPDFAGGSFVIVQKYLHDLASWDALDVDEQERVIGRSKADDIEMDDAVKPLNSHVALNTIEDEDGTKSEIVRDNMPFYNFRAGEFGTYFIGYAANPGVIEQMLENMFLGQPPGNYDRILDFSTAVTGTSFFVPTTDFFDDPPAAPPVPQPPAPEPPGDQAAAPPTPAADGSLGIGSLKRSTPR